MKRLVCALALLLMLDPFPCAAEPQVAEDAERFCQEYESLNGRPTEDGLNNYPTMILPESISIRYAQFSDVQALLDGGTGVLYMGFPECPWCRALLPALFEAANRFGSGAPMWYFNAVDLRDIRSLDEAGNIVTEREASPEYQALVERLYEWLPAYEGLNEPEIKRIYFPTVVFVRNGDIQSVHVGTLAEQSNPYTPFEPEAYEELVDALAAQFAAICP